MFSDYIREVIDFIGRCAISPSRHILEVACGAGEFLFALANAIPEAEMTGVDPSLIPHRENRITFEATLFDRAYVDGLAVAPDMLINRHMIEHIQAPDKMLGLFSDALAENGVLYLETPRLDWILQNGTFFDFCYEHCSYFTDDFMKRMLTAAGFEIDKIKYSFQEQYFLNCARRRSPLSQIAPASPEELLRTQQGFL